MRFFCFLFLFYFEIFWAIISSNIYFEQKIIIFSSILLFLSF